MLIAVTRAVSPSLADCELTHLPREPINIATAIAEHACYEEALRSLGATVIRAPAEPTLPDAVFVEDTALVLEEAAVITRPGAPSRRPEVESMASILSTYKPVHRIESPATVDGGDLLLIGRTLYVGRSSRTNREGLAQLASVIKQWGYVVVPVPIDGCLHLKSAVTQVAEHLLLINARWVRPECFGAMETVLVAPAEPGGANALRIGGAVICPSHHPRTAERLERAGIRVVSVPCREVAKAEGGVTCCSVVFEASSQPGEPGVA